MKIKLLAAFVLASAFSLWLSGRICGGGGEPRPLADAYFDTDMVHYVNILTGPVPPRPSPLHALFNFGYRPPTRLLAMALGASPGDDGGRALLASRMLVAVFFGIGVAAMVRIAGQLDVDDRKLAVLVPMILLASSNGVATVPESYGVSFGLLAACASVLLMPLEPARRALALAVGAVLCGGTTATNAVYPGGALGLLYLRDRTHGGLRPGWLTPRRIAAIALTPVVAGVVFLAVARVRFVRFYEHVFSYLHFTIIRHPLRALRDALTDLMFPVVAAYPAAGGHRLTFGVPEGLTWTWVHWVAVIAWCLLMALGVAEGLRNRALRGFTLGLIGWLGFNLLLHSVWGAVDHGLYMPHWSWALLILAMLAARRLSVGALVVLCVPVVAAQAMTLRFILGAIPSLSGG